ncbi:TIGR03790 family protein [soil metagenome]
MRWVAVALLAGCGSGGTNQPMPDAGSGGAPEVLTPRTGITSNQMAVLVNDDDPLSVSIADYYVTARSIPATNVVHLHVPAGATLSVANFTPLAAQVDAALAGTAAEAMAITWTQPYAVGYMSITSAFALGYIPQDPTTNACSNTSPKCGPDNPYVVDPNSTAPFTDHAFRPAMTIPATTLAEATALIDRGVASDNTWPKGSAYLMDTSDKVRSARCVLNPTYGYINECQLFLDTWDTTGSGIDANIVMADSISDKPDVLFYVQGLASVPGLATNTYLPGAVADHLTSYGGDIPTSGQMSCFEFIRAGATGSFGTVVEPYAVQQKFPDPRVLIPRYFGGATLVEAYWKSVSAPGMGIFIGEPLARPFGTGFRSSFADGVLTIETTAMIPGHTYVIEAADTSQGPFTQVLSNLSVAKYQISTFTIPDATAHTYRFRE